MSKITEYPAVTRFDTDDVLLKDGTNGTKKIKAKDAAVEFAGLISPINHRNIYRGKSLGISVTSAQKAAIQNGSFDDLFIGDYWTINSVNWVIADMDYFLRCGDVDFNTHHLVMVPQGILGNAKMNETNTTEGGYVGSAMYKTGLNDAKSKITTAFGSMVKTHKEYLVNATSGGHASAGAWVESTVELMNEIMVYGCPIFTPMGSGTVTPTNYTLGKQQLALFALSPRAVNIRTTYWLRDVVSATAFADVYYYGDAVCDGASISYGVRPYFVIG